MSRTRNHLAPVAVTAVFIALLIPRFTRGDSVSAQRSGSGQLSACSVPKAFGAFKGAAAAQTAAFEDTSGTIRIVDCVNAHHRIVAEFRRN